MREPLGYSWINKGNNNNDTWRNILHSYLDNNLWVLGLVFATLGLTNYLFSKQAINQNLSLVMASVGAVDRTDQFS